MDAPCVATGKDLSGVYRCFRLAPIDSVIVDFGNENECSMLAGMPSSERALSSGVCSVEAASPFNSLAIDIGRRIPGGHVPA